MTDEKRERAQFVFERFGPTVKAKTLRENKLFSRDVAELVSVGLIRKIKAGYYVWTAYEDELTDLELVSSIIPHGIICLQSSASYHDLSTLNPVAISIAVPSDSMLPVLPSFPPIELVRVSSRMFNLGLLNEAGIHGRLRIYDKERTVCDFFRKRKTLGMDLTLEVLKSYMSGKPKLQALFEYAEQLHVATVIRPYVEALL